MKNSMGRYIHRDIVKSNQIWIVIALCSMDLSPNVTPLDAKSMGKVGPVLVKDMPPSPPQEDPSPFLVKIVAQCSETNDK